MNPILSLFPFFQQALTRTGNIIRLSNDMLHVAKISGYKVRKVRNYNKLFIYQATFLIDIVAYFSNYYWALQCYEMCVELLPGSKLFAFAPLHLVFVMILKFERLLMRDVTVVD